MTSFASTTPFTPPDRTQLPLRAQPQEVVLNEELIAKFNRAFENKTGEVPPTFPAVALQGVFQILNDLHVDWKGLLHATQSFEFHRPIHPPLQLEAVAELKDCRLRGGMWWLQFEATMTDKETGNPVITSKSLIMVKGS